MTTTRIIEEAIDYASLVNGARTAQSGAVVLFLGTVRELSEGQRVAELYYEAYVPMALAKLDELAAQAIAKWSLNDCRIVHRIGRLDLGDIAVAITTASAHRAEAFDAARWIMDEIKCNVPIWKRETFAGGATDWIHPAGQKP